MLKLDPSTRLSYLGAYTKAELIFPYSALGGLALIDDTGISGETVLTMQNSMGSEHLYIVCVRMLNGSTGLFGPWAYLLYMRPQNWDYALIGEEQNVVDKDIQNGKLTITFSEECWVRMVTYRIF